MLSFVLYNNLIEYICTTAADKINSQLIVSALHRFIQAR